MKVRIVSPGWETYTGSLGHRCMFENGESTSELTPRDVRRIGSGMQIVDVETGLQVGPGADHANLSVVSAPVAVEMVTKADMDAAAEVTAEAEREKLASEEEARKAQEAKDLEAAKAKAESDAKLVVYSRQELEAIGANDGIDGLRTVATPLGVKGRSIAEMVDAVLAAQSKIAAE